LKKFSFSGLSFSLSVNDQLSPVGLPMAIIEQEDTDLASDIHINVDIGTLEEDVPGGPAKLKRGRMEAYGSNETLVWVHPEIGPVSVTDSNKGKIDIVLPAWAWQKTENIFDQLVLPAILPAFAMRGLRGVHASSIEVHKKGILIAGPSGSGKTTTALYAISNGAHLISDDMTFMFMEDSKRMIGGLGDGIKAHDYTWDRFRYLQPGSVDLAGKRLLRQDRVPWVKKSPLKYGLIFTNKFGNQERIKDKNAIPLLLELCYHISENEIILRLLTSILKEVPFYAVKGPESAAEFIQKI